MTPIDSSRLLVKVLEVTKPETQRVSKHAVRLPFAFSRDINYLVQVTCTCFNQAFLLAIEKAAHVNVSL